MLPYKRVGLYHRDLLPPPRGPRAARRTVTNVWYWTGRTAIYDLIAGFMFHPLSLFVGLRYVRARSHKFFVSFITWVSLAGVCVGVVALITILSVMNGFESELRDRLLSLSAHARVVAKADEPHTSPPSPAEWDAARKAILGVTGVEAVAPYAELQVLALRTPEMLPVTLRGMDPAVEGTVTDIGKSIVEGRLADLEAGTDRVIIGEVVAQRLAVITGDSVTLLIPSVTDDGAPAPKLRELKVAGIFEVGMTDHDGTLMLANISDVRSLDTDTQSGEGLRVRFSDPLAAPVLAQAVASALPARFQVVDWTQDHANYFRAIRIEKTMMALILLLIVAVAAFNLVSMLVMVVTDKRTDIAILRTFGASPARVMGVFITQGLFIGWFGVSLGVIFGVLLAKNVGEILAWLERTLGFQVWDADVYYITTMPSELHWDNVIWIAGAALLLTAAATVYPAWRASRVAPAEALRYE